MDLLCKLRQQILENRELIRKLLPTKQQHEHLQHIAVHGATTAHQLGVRFSITDIAANQSLKALYKQGYLVRRGVPATTRPAYVYSLHPDLKP